MKTWILLILATVMAVSGAVSAILKRTAPPVAVAVVSTPAPVVFYGPPMPPRRTQSETLSEYRERRHSGNFVITEGRNGTTQIRELEPGVSHRQSIGGGR